MLRCGDVGMLRCGLGSPTDCLSWDVGMLVSVRMWVSVLGWGVGWDVG